MDQNADFSGWAKVELMGRNVIVGYVTTRYFGPGITYLIPVTSSWALRCQESEHDLNREEKRSEQGILRI